MASLRRMLVISPEWQTRALLAAQLSELCACDVLPAPGVQEAARLAGARPAIVVLDAGAELQAEDVEEALSTFPSAPAVLVVSGLRQAEFDALRERCAAFLVRPVSVGQVAKATAEARAKGTQAT